MLLDLNFSRNSFTEKAPILLVRCSARFRQIQICSHSVKWKIGARISCVVDQAFCTKYQYSENTVGCERRKHRFFPPKKERNHRLEDP